MQGAKWRFVLLSTVLSTPFLHLLLEHHYGFFHPEVLVALALFLVPCMLLALASKNETVFHALALTFIVINSINAVHVNLFPEARLKWIVLGVAVLTAAAIYAMRRQFYYIVLVFAAAVLVTDVAKEAVEEISLPALAESGQDRSNLQHVLYLIFDEQINLAGFPEDIPECVEAELALRQVLSDNHFTIYPNAFSNYRSSWDSIPSILNLKLLERTGEYFRDQPFRPTVRNNRLFARYAAKGYAINAYYSDYIRFSSSPEYPITSRTYDANNLAAIHRLGLTWEERLHQILTVYFQADTALWGAYVRVAPQRYQPERLGVGPLAVSDVWPGQILADIRAADRNTLFFAHLLTPHFPYVYDAEGRVRKPEESKSEGGMETFDRAEYVRRYRQYANQVRWLSRQLGRFLQGLQEMGVYDSMTVVIHGDHGSRIRLLRESERDAWMQLRATTPDCPAVSRYDYVSEPELQDLLDRFSALLAVKRPRARQAQIVEEMGSVSHFLRKEFEPADEVPDERLNAVYLFDARGTPQEIPLLKIWRNHSEVSTTR